MSVLNANQLQNLKPGSNLIVKHDNATTLGNYFGIDNENNSIILNNVVERHDSDKQSKFTLNGEYIFIGNEEDVNNMSPDDAKKASPSSVNKATTPPDINKASTSPVNKAITPPDAPPLAPVEPTVVVAKPKQAKKMPNSVAEIAEMTHVKLIRNFDDIKPGMLLIRIHNYMNHLFKKKIGKVSVVNKSDKTAILSNVVSFNVYGDRDDMIEEAMQIDEGNVWDELVYEASGSYMNFLAFNRPSDTIANNKRLEELNPTGYFYDEQPVDVAKPKEKKPKDMIPDTTVAFIKKKADEYGLTPISDISKVPQNTVIIDVWIHDSTKFTVGKRVVGILKRDENKYEIYSVVDFNKNGTRVSEEPSMHGHPVKLDSATMFEATGDFMGFLQQGADESALKRNKKKNDKYPISYLKYSNSGGKRKDSILGATRKHSILGGKSKRIVRKLKRNITMKS